jgi:hypothetical protein
VTSRVAEQRLHRRLGLGWAGHAHDSTCLAATAAVHLCLDQRRLAIEALPGIAGIFPPGNELGRRYWNTSGTEKGLGLEFVQVHAQ